MPNSDEIVSDMPDGRDARQALAIANLLKWGECFCAVWEGETCLSCLNATAIADSGLDWHDERDEASKRGEIP